MCDISGRLDDSALDEKGIIIIFTHIGDTVIRLISPEMGYHALESNGVITHLLEELDEPSTYENQ